MIRPDHGCTLAVTAITGRKQNASGSDPACLLDIYIYIYIYRERERERDERERERERERECLRERDGVKAFRDFFLSRYSSSICHRCASCLID